MSAANSSRCLFCTFATATPPARTISQRFFHSSRVDRGRRKPTFKNILAIDLRQPTTSKNASQGSQNIVKAVSPRQSVSRPAHSRRDFTNDPIRSQRALPTKQVIIQDGDVGTGRSPAETYPPYTPRELQLLALKYTPEQMEALRAGEQAFDPQDLVLKGRMRTNQLRIEYSDDFSKILPVIDHPVKGLDEDQDMGIRQLEPEEVQLRFVAWYDWVVSQHREALGLDDDGLNFKTEPLMQRDQSGDVSTHPLELERERLESMKAGMATEFYPEDGLTTEERFERLRTFAQRHEGLDAVASFEQFVSDPANFYYSPVGARLDQQSDVLAAELPRLHDPRMIIQKESDDPAFDRLSKQTGMSVEEMKRLYTKQLVSHRVVNQTRMGKIQSQYFLYITGNENGMLGIGEGKGTEAEDGIRKAMMNSIRNMKPVPRYEGRTVFGDIEGKVGASIVKLSARGPGFGVRCQSLIYEMARAAGLKDLSARCVRSRNKMNVVKATYEALMSQKMPEEVAMARGRKMVDVRKVYYDGAVN